MEGRLRAGVLGLSAAAVGAQVAPAITAIGPVRRRAAPVLSGRSTTPHVALTFDDGPDRTSTPAVLDVLASFEVRATFFVLGRMLEPAPDLGARIVAEGHELAVHGWDHMCTTLRSRRRLRADLAGTVELVESVGGVTPRWYRPPFGVLSGTALGAVADVGLRPVLWTAWGRDWTSTATGDSIVRTVRRGAGAGATVLLHDADTTSAPGSWRNTLAALPQLLTGWRADGLAVGPLSEHGGPFAR